MENQATPPSPAPVHRRYVPLIVAAFFATLLIGGGYFALRGALNPGFLGWGGAEECDLPPGAQPDLDYSKWEKPLVAIVVSGQMHGYINPCGCSQPMNGGLERRYNFIDSLKTKGWNVVGIDLGELPDTKGINEQKLLKYDLSVKALRAMNYRVIGIGRDEVLLPLPEAMTQIWDKNNPLPRPLNMTLDKTAPGAMYHGLNVRPFEIIDTTTPKIGVINMMGPDLTDTDLADSLAKKEKFVKNIVELPRALKAFADGGVEIGVILHHEYPNLDENKFPKGGIARLLKVEEIREAQALKLAKFCAEERVKNGKIPPIHLMMLLMDEPEPPAFLKELDPKLPTRIVEIGHKGKYVGLIGVYRDKQGYRLHYQKVLMSEEWMTPEAKKPTQPIIALMEKYNLDLKAADMLARVPRTIHFNQLPEMNQKGLKATYVGSERCSGCHAAAHKIWEASPHAKASVTLEKLKHPSNQHYDPECMKCHTTGFQHPGGYNDFVPNLADWPAKPKDAPEAARVAKHNKNLRGVGCESCHGPASEHVKNVKDAAIHKLINPYKPTPVERQLEDTLVKDPKDVKALQTWLELSERRRRAIEASNCIKCHDPENDVNWGTKGKDIVARWLLDPKHRLIHHTPNNNGAALPAKDAPAAVLGPPPLVIEVVPEKK